MTKYQEYFIDLDGTIYQGTKSFPSGKRFIERLQATGQKFMFVTNNSTKTPEDVVKNLAEGHDIHVDVSQVYTSAMATADYIKRALPSAQKILTVGEQGLDAALQKLGFQIVTQGDADVVVVGLDRQVQYDDLMNATLAIQHGAEFVVTNIDTNLPSEKGFIPGAGAVVAAVQTAVQKMPHVVGKPYPTIMEGALQRADLTSDQVLMVGDNYQTDIKAGIGVKMDTLLVYTGVSTPQQVQQETIQPTYTINSLDEWEV
ncbi:hypothetical protein IV73_GL001088 [Weissella kandleri]|uniref:Acid sugar phosphatase n=1 Tax=Weissella kandleri TaxID=1616 RepID=A0A0R2JC06_9LACO|nr:TIGR01457 family HAD-type hydrolase [Weissella kandleri]KRN74811.1 hypothetical protein IV73_GL001088 [Weissella kandleri]